MPVIALDGDRCGGELGLRLARSASGSTPRGCSRSGRSWSRTMSAPLAMVLGDISAEAGVTPDCRRMVLAALQVKGVPRISVEEALWTAAEILLDP